MTEETQEKLGDQINQLEKLLAILNIDDNTNEIVYDYESEETNEENENPYYVKTEEGETSYGRKRKNYFDNNYDYKEPNWNYERIHTGIKYRSIPIQYQPKINLENQDILNIDCVENEAQKIEEWYNRHRVLITLNQDLQNLSAEEIFSYLRHKTTGKVLNYLGGLTTEEKEKLYKSKNNIETIDNLLRFLALEFIGKDINNEKSEIGFEEACYWRLMNLRICNMCYVDNYICEFEEHYYKLGREKQKEALPLFYGKLPEMVRKTIKEGYENLVKEGIIGNSLGAMKTTLKNWIQEECNKYKTKKEAAISLCCKRMKIGNYGCKEPRKKKRKWKRIPKHKYQKYKNSKRLFRKRTPQKKQNKYCPQGKRKCRCWICHEEGHYANECKKRKSTEVNTLRLAFEEGYIPLESDIESDEELYGYVTDSSIEYDEEDS